MEGTEKQQQEEVILLDDEESYEDKYKLYYWVPLSHNDTVNSNSEDIQCQSSSNDLLQNIAGVSNGVEEEEEVMESQDIATTQTSDSLYMCSVCKKTYKSKYYVKYHLKKAHGCGMMEESNSENNLAANTTETEIETEIETGQGSNSMQEQEQEGPVNQDVVLISDSDSEEEPKLMQQYSTLEFQGSDADFLQNQQHNYIIVMNSDQMSQFPENCFLQVPDDGGNFILPETSSNDVVTTVKNSNIYICDESDCKMPFPHEKLLRNHKLMTHKKRSFSECKFCKEGFLTKRDLKIHIEQSHENGTNKYRICGVCNSKFELSADYYQHFFTHPNCNICYICGTNFEYNTSLLLHQKEHRKHEKPRAQIICQICGMSYFLESSYQKHYQICCKILEEKNKRQE